MQTWKRAILATSVLAVGLAGLLQAVYEAPEDVVITGEYALLLPEEDTEAFQAVDAMLINVFCGHREPVDGGEIVCPDDAASSLTQRHVDKDGNTWIGAQWSVSPTQERALKVQRLPETVLVLKSRQAFREAINVLGVKND